MPSADNLATVEQDRSGSVVTAATRPCSSQDGILYTDVVVIGEWKFYCDTIDFICLCSIRYRLAMKFQVRIARGCKFCHGA